MRVKIDNVSCKNNIDLKKIAEKKLEKLDKFLNKNATCKIIINEKAGMLEMRVSNGAYTYCAREKFKEARESIDKLILKIRNQIVYQKYTNN